MEEEDEPIDILDKTNFVLPAEYWDEFVELLENPPSPKENLKKLMRMVPPWENNNKERE